jgi:L-amino acid N-acyltransferase YncA
MTVELSGSRLDRVLIQEISKNNCWYIIARQSRFNTENNAYLEIHPQMTVELSGSRLERVLIEEIHENHCEQSTAVKISDQNKAYLEPMTVSKLDNQSVRLWEGAL